MAENLGDSYEDYTKKNIIIKNDGELCTFGKFNYNLDPIDGFNSEISCNSKIRNLTVEDKTLSGTFAVSKVYEIDTGKEIKRFVGKDVLKFEEDPGFGRCDICGCWEC